MRWSFQLALHDLMKRDERVFLLWADVGAGLFKKHREDFPTRCLNAGTMEQSTVSMAAGMAMQGFRPIVYTITPFLIERAFEQIKLDVDQMNLPVGLVGHSDDSCGPTHKERDAVAMMKMLPNIQARYPYYKDDIRQLIPPLGFASTLAPVDYDRPWFMALKTVA